MIDKTQREKPAGATHWSPRTLAQVVDVRPASVRRIWLAHGLKPHRVKGFNLPAAVPAGGHRVINEDLMDRETRFR